MLRPHELYLLCVIGMGQMQVCPVINALGNALLENIAPRAASCPQCVRRDTIALMVRSVLLALEVHMVVLQVRKLTGCLSWRLLYRSYVCNGELYISEYCWTDQSTI